MSKLYIYFTFFILFITIGKLADAQDEKAENNIEKSSPEAAPAKRTKVPKPKPYATVITSEAKTSIGFFKVHEVKDRYYFEIPNTMLGRDILVVSRIMNAPPKTSPSGERGTMFSGDQIGENMIAFIKGQDNRIFLELRMEIENGTDSTDGVSKALKANEAQPLVASFDIKAFTPDSNGVVIDMTDYISGDNDILFFDKRVKKGAGGITTIDAKASYIQSVKPFPINIEIATIKNYKTPNGVFLTYGLNTSMVLLPKEPMMPRYEDPRVGYFSNKIIDFDAQKNGADIRGYVARWRLEPKPQDMDKYFKGELVEPQKPIIIYIDPATPKKWVPYLIAGINDWQKAFEQAGFKNAIMGKEAPADDPNWSLQNALYSAIVYKPSKTPNASGPHVSDPRSGEILETHINWYHNVQTLIRQWYFVQCANVDTAARKPEFSNELMGSLIRFVSSHEVGHTLGLKHNFGSSSTMPVELLRNKAWVEANGHTPSIMDYARFNYVAQPEDNISEKGLFPRIGAYDKWAIQWAYTIIPKANTPDDEQPVLNKWVADSLGANPYLFYGAQGLSDPRSQAEVIGDNPMVANDYGIKNLKAILPHLMDWVNQPNDDYGAVREMHKTLVGQYQRYLGHVLGYLTGRYITYNSNDNTPEVKYIPKEKQKEALAFFNKHYFVTPAWLLYDPQIISYYGSLPREFTVNQESLINILLGSSIQRNISNQSFYEVNDTYRLEEFLKDLDNYILSDILSGKPLPDYHRRNLQRIYISGLAGKIIPGATTETRVGPFLFTIDANADKLTDAYTILKVHIAALDSQLKKAVQQSADSDVKEHLIYLQGILDNALKATLKATPKKGK
ncbi:MAG: zinc-dependent metalloprotease [Niabella sp.]